MAGEARRAAAGSASAGREEYGGRGAGPVEHYIVTEELARARAPELVGRIGVNLVGPDAARARHARAASTLAAQDPRAAESCGASSSASPARAATSRRCRRRATRTDGGWLLNGQKVWTSYAQFADWGVCLARTDPDVAEAARASPRFVVDMRAPGRRGAAAAPDHRRVRVQRGVLHRRVRPRRPARRPGARGLARRELDAHPRARRQPAPARDPRAARRRAAAARGSNAARSTTTALAPRLAQAYVEVRIFQLHNWRSISRTAKGDDARARSAASTSSGGAR